jgi:hypothetical protein
MIGKIFIIELLVTANYLAIFYSLPVFQDKIERILGIIAIVLIFITFITGLFMMQSLRN